MKSVENLRRPLNLLWLMESGKFQKKHMVVKWNSFDLFLIITTGFKSGRLDAESSGLPFFYNLKR
ncbi:protein of unknown function [Maridesulfovibrio hydrothermalis AM13 = DSM 14728]|uniref:Uncharacterized protein n=1 Tax=Maridesulfovibrio hydrothermalis AM13 = DSM 14728 TaxID=1121451 RepID=L0RF98_9BACT|nr:protein of unknown function [Maridesulfovibrio hydrothermalis AM13 = DSM 14728]